MTDEKEEKLTIAFARIKQDIDFLKQEIDQIRQDLGEIVHFFTRAEPSTHLPTHPQHFDTQDAKYEGVKPYFAISRGNQGVPADSQQTFDTSKTREIEEKSPQQTQKLSLRHIKRIVDNLTEDLKLKFKSLSRQEFYIFSLIYNLDIQDQKPDYRTIAIKANLTESSVRDYISRLIHKGIPLKKQKINNKSIIISISEELKNLATLDNLTKLKERSYNDELGLNSQI